MIAYEPVTTVIEGTEFRALPLNVTQQLRLIFELNTLFAKGLKDAFGLEVGDLLRTELDPNFDMLSQEQQEEHANAAIFTKLPQSFFGFMAQIDPALSEEFIKKYLSMCLISDGSIDKQIDDGKPVFRNVIVDEDLDARKLVHFKLLGWYLAVQLGPFIGWTAVLIRIIQGIFPEKKSTPTKS